MAKRAPGLTARSAIRTASHMKRRPKRKGPQVGRPRISFRADKDRHAVALLEMMLNTRMNGRFPSERTASALAACGKEGHLQGAQLINHAPIAELAPGGRRNSPTHSALKDGYQEFEIGHVELRQGGTALTNCALRLRRKHRRWSKDSSARDWLRPMAKAWAAAMYPHALRRDCKQEPSDICRAAAAAAGEVDFLDRRLLPFLRDQEASAENRLMCQIVTFDIF
jgi:hypothetical protein